MNYYDSIYRGSNFYWGLEADEIIYRFMSMPSGKKLLDLGCGEGRNSFLLSKNGYQVTAIDYSKIGIQKLNQYSKKNHLKIDSGINDAEEYLETCEKFDTIFALNIFQSMCIEKIHRIIERMKDRTNNGGYNIIISVVSESQEQKNEILKKNNFLFDSGELKKYYNGWGIEFYKEKYGKIENHGYGEHRHLYVEIISKKP